MRRTYSLCLILSVNEKKNNRIIYDELSWLSSLLNSLVGVNLRTVRNSFLALLRNQGTTLIPHFVINMSAISSG